MGKKDIEPKLFFIIEIQKISFFSLRKGNSSHALQIFWNFKKLWSDPIQNKPSSLPSSLDSMKSRDSASKEKQHWNSYIPKPRPLASLNTLNAFFPRVIPCFGIGVTDGCAFNAQRKLAFHCFGFAWSPLAVYD